MDPDDAAYRKSVRNMSVVLALIVIIVFAALYIPPYVNPVRQELNASASDSSSGYPLVLSVKLNATMMTSEGSISIVAQVNGTSRTIQNITTRNAWAIEETLLWTRPCTSGWPVGIAIMKGFYTLDNYKTGAVLTLKSPKYLCPIPSGSPAYFLLEPSGSRAVVSINGAFAVWELQTSLVFGPGSTVEGGLLSGPYTVIAADEWGDIAFAHFAA